tara:strand:- start:423 stop:1319 length:897 start_codon:yes stop_codon:yes gene_type:complete
LYPLAILIGGPTATNKTELAFEIQNKTSGSIINADSMQVYKELRTLTNTPDDKDLNNYSCELFRFINYPKKCNVGFWFENVQKLLLNSNGKIPIFVGGTGLYLDSLYGTISPIPEVPLKIRNKIEKIHSRLGNAYFFKKLQEVDEEYSKVISKNDSQRLVRAVTVKITTGKNMSYWHSLKSNRIFKKIIYVVISDDREKIYESINKRCLRILKSDIKMEIKEFLEKKKNIEHPLHKCIGLEILNSYIDGKFRFKETLDMFSQQTRQYAKRQITWFKNRSSDSIKMEFKEAKKFLLKNI